MSTATLEKMNAEASRGNILHERAAPLIAKQSISLVESGENGRLRARGPSQRIDAKNENNRVYPRTVWEKNLIEGADFRKRLKEHKVMGELEHPETGDTNLSRVSHLIENASIEHLGADNEFEVPEGDYIMVDSVVLDTPSGKILKELFDVGVPVGISSRGRGNTVDQDGVEVVQEDYQLDTFDYVSSPSVAEAHHRPVREQVDPSGIPAEGPAATPPLGSESPGGGEQPTPDNVGETESEMSSEEVETLIREMQVEVVDDIKLKDAAGLLSRAIDTLDELGSRDDPLTAKLRGQVIVLAHIITAKIEKMGEGGSSGTESEGETNESTVTDDKEIDEQADGRQMDNLVGQYSRERGTNKGTVFRGELENVLNRFGHRPEQASIAALASSMRQAGYSVQDAEYGRPPGTDQRQTLAVAETKRGETVDRKHDKTIDTAASAEEKKARVESLRKRLKESKVKRDSTERFKNLEETRVNRSEVSNLEKEIEDTKVRLSKSEAKYSTSVKIIAEMSRRIKRMNLQQYIEGQTKDLGDQESIGKVLSECNTKEQVDARLEGVKKLIGEKRKDATLRDPLPPVMLTEDSKKRAAVNPEKSLAESTSHPLIAGVMKRYKVKKAS